MFCRKIIISIALCLVAFPETGCAQIKQTALKAWNWFIAPKKYLDSAWVEQPKPRFDISAGYKAQWNGVGLTVPYMLGGVVAADEEFNFGFKMDLVLVNRTSHNLGLYAGYGPINIGYSIGIGQQNKGNRSFSFDWVNSFYGAQFYYGHFSEMMKATSVSLRNDEVPIPVKMNTDMNIIRVDGYYAFNRKKFSYQAAYKGRMVQKRSAGSVIAGAKYMHAGFSFDRDEPIFMVLLHGMCGYATDQVSLGAGYSFNFVPYHKDQISNLTMNLTAIPLLTFVNEVTVVQMEDNGGSSKRGIHGKLQPNFIARAAVSYVIGHFHFCTRFDFQYNVFRTGDIVILAKDLGVQGAQPDAYVSYSVNGKISNWVAGLDIHYRF